MKIFIYTSVNHDNETLLSAIYQIAPDENIEVIDSIDGLSMKLRHPKEEKTFAILMTKTHEELIELNLIKNQFRNIRIILLVADEQDSTLALAHRLNPRFLSSIRENYKDLIEVLAKMI